MTTPSYPGPAGEVDPAIPPEVWNAIASAATVVFDRPYFSRRNRLVHEVVYRLRDAGFPVCRLVTFTPGTMTGSVRATTTGSTVRYLTSSSPTVKRSLTVPRWRRRLAMKLEVAAAWIARPR